LAILFRPFNNDCEKIKLTILGPDYGNSVCTNKIITFPKSKENHLDKAGLTLYLSEFNLDK
jgi:hypothetical protein